MEKNKDQTSNHFKDIKDLNNDTHRLCRDVREARFLKRTSPSRDTSYHKENSKQAKLPHHSSNESVKQTQRISAAMFPLIPANFKAQRFLYSDVTKTIVESIVV